MKLINKIRLTSGLAIAPILAFADPVVFSFDAAGLEGGWTQVEGLLTGLEYDATAGVAGGGGLVHNDTLNPAEEIMYVYDQSVGAFGSGTVSMKFFFSKDGQAGRPLLIGLTTEPGVTPKPFSSEEGDPSFIGVMLRDSSTPTRFRPEILATTSNGGTAPGRIVMGQGFPETFVDFVDNSWYELRMTIIDEGDGKWNLLAGLALLNDDGTQVVDDGFKVNDYNDIQSRSTNPDLQPPLEPMTEFSQATALYPFVSISGAKTAGVVGIDDISFDLGGSATENWYGYPVVDDAWVDTGDWLGWVYTGFDPWVWSVSLSKYIYVGDDSGWVYVPR